MKPFSFVLIEQDEKTCFPSLIFSPHRKKKQQEFYDWINTGQNIKELKDQS